MKKKKLLIWGTGAVARTFVQQYAVTYEKYFDIVGFINSNKEGKFHGWEIYKPNRIHDLEWDKILLCTLSDLVQEEMLQYLDDIYVDRTKVDFYSKRKGMNLLKEFVQDRYRDCEDKEIKEILEYLSEHELTVYNQYVPEESTIYQYYQDDEGDPYVYIGNKRMYYPKEIVDITKTPFRKNIFMEQTEYSPHRYIQENHEVHGGDVIVDAGVCEGNFSIQYVDIASKLHLIEMDKRWCRALEKTFAPWRNKVTIHNVALSKEDGRVERRLDTLIKENIDFLKMDIEGAEIDALLGAKELLERSNAICSICAYHRTYDEKYIRFILEAYGYTTKTSDGYMAFVWDKNWYDKLDFRRGIVYAQKRI